MKNKPQSYQGVSAKHIKGVRMFSDGGKQIATASETAKKILMDSRKKSTEKDNWAQTWWGVLIIAVIAGTIAIILGAYFTNNLHLTGATPTQIQNNPKQK